MRCGVDMRGKEGFFCKTSRKNDKIVVLFLMFPVLLVSLFLSIKILPAKYYFDNARILSMVTKSGAMQAWEGSYRTAANIFSFLDVFKLSTLPQWRILLCVVFMVVFDLLILCAAGPGTIESFYILASYALLNIYVFNIGKDIIQFCIFLVVAIVLAIPSRKYIWKEVLAILIISSESLFFRHYYILVAVLVAVSILVLEYAYSSLRKEELSNRIVLRRAFFQVLTFIFAMMIVLYVASNAMYTQVATVRYATNESRLGGANANSMINDWIIPNKRNANPILFILNYIVDAIRMLFPVELLFKGVTYLPFCLFQIFTIYFIIRAVRECLKDSTHIQRAFLGVFIGYFLASVFFEPDFGSWIRHEIAVFPILLFIILPPSSIRRVPQMRDRGNSWR